MNEVIGFFFDTLEKIWIVITSDWLLAVGFLLFIFGFIIDLYKQGREK